MRKYPASVFSQGMPQARYIVPRFVERTSQGSREYDPYARLFEERIVFLGSEIDDTSASDVMSQLLCLEATDPDRDISIYINSPGGSLTALMAIYDTMQFVKPDIQTVCIGQASSSAAIVLAAGTRGKRVALPNARILVHQPSSPGHQGQISDLEIQAREMERVRSQLETVLAKHCERDVAQVRQDLERDNILTAQQAVEYGLIDQVITPRSVVRA